MSLLNTTLKLPSASLNYCPVISARKPVPNPLYVVVFDFDGVFFKGWHESWNNGIPEGCACWTKNLKPDLGISAREFSAYYKSDLEREVLLGEEKLPAAFQRLIWEIEEKGKFSYIDRNIHYKLLRYWLKHHSAPNPAMVHFAAALKQTGLVRTAALTNNDILRTRHLLNRKVGEGRIKDCFDHVVCSGEYHMKKPDPELFRACHKEIFKTVLPRPLNTDGVRVIYIDDHFGYTKVPGFLGWESVTFTGMEDIVNHEVSQKLLPKQVLSDLLRYPNPFKGEEECKPVRGPKEENTGSALALCPLQPVIA